MVLDMRSVLNIPKVPFEYTLAAGMAMAGFRIVPEDLWDLLSEKLGVCGDEEEEEEDEDFLRTRAEAAGFTFVSNHIRGDAHDVWQGLTLADEFEDGSWFVPINELVGDDECALVSRLMFSGSEEELREAVAKL